MGGRIDGQRGEKMQLTIYEKFLEKHKEEAREEAEATYEESVLEDYKPLEFIGTLNVDEIFYDKGSVYISGNFKVDKDELAYIGLEIDMPLDILIEILKDYVNRVNRIKTILEAVKK